ncbi:MAG: hypothetical protein ABWY00_16635 [Dongiaceae bacterium]
MMVDDKETVELAGLLETETGLAFLIDFGGRMEWIPKTQARCSGAGIWTLTRQIAKKKGLID